MTKDKPNSEDWNSNSGTPENRAAPENRAKSGRESGQQDIEAGQGESPNDEASEDGAEDASNDAFFASGDLGNSEQDDSPEALIQELEQQVVEFRDRELKAQAELENFRRRMLRDVEQQIRYASIPLVTDLLDVLDNLNRAIDSATPGASIDSVVAGVRMVQQQFVNVLGKHHCKQIPSLGQPFDPNVHQAISQLPSDQHPAGNVMVEHSVGYMMHDRVVRPSMVVVSTGKPNA